MTARKWALLIRCWLDEETIRDRHERGEAGMWKPDRVDFQLTLDLCALSTSWP